MKAAAALLLFAALAALAACDTRQAFHEPDPTLARMMEQRRADPYAPSDVFADGKTMRDPLPFTVARDSDDPAAPPPAVTRELLARGRASFERVCATCHGIAGDGRSAVAARMHGRPPPSLHEARIRAFLRARLYQVATEGYGLMPGYADMLRAGDRWAVASYVQALQLSQNADVRALPDDVRAALAKEAP
ncbi:MAG: ABC-type Fe3+ transport system protein [Labilithrix sp.]|nr:ABC-type Fe3+ transport system protein [Labilithrix sp.]